MIIAANMEIYKTFVIESAHRLPNLPENHKCSRLHGHSFIIEVHVSGSNDNTNGWVMDFSDIGFLAITIGSCAGFNAVPQPSHSELPFVTVSVPYPNIALLF